MSIANSADVAPGTTQYVPAQSRTGTALCLSGGGYRAALFHLGAVRRLNELGVLGRLDAVSAVSGGSIFAAFLAVRMGGMTGGRFADYERDVAVPFRRVTKHDVRTTPALRRLLPWEWANAGAQAEGLQAKYEQLLVPGATLRDLPVRPRFHFCATDLVFGVNWTFARDKVGDYQAGYMSPGASGAVPLARAVAASSCFPPVFKPMPLHLEPDQLPVPARAAAGPDRDDCVRAISLTDGGVYDNMGLEPVWKSCQTLLVCDGGKPFRFTRDADTPHQILRINDVMGDQAKAVRKRWLVASYVQRVYGGAYWGIGGSVGKYGLPDAPGYTAALADQVIAGVRTDMDEFSDAEAAVLENHGYALAAAAIRRHVPELDGPVPLAPPAPDLWPDPDRLATVEADVRRLLADSAHVRALGH